MSTTSHTSEPWSHHYAQGKSFVLSKAHDAGLFTGDVIASEGTDQNALANHARIVSCVNACAGIQDPEAAINLLQEAPCTCPEHETGIGMMPGHEDDNADCFKNRARRFLRA